VSSNKSMKNKLVNTMRATKAGTSNADTSSAEKAAPVAEKAAPVAEKAAPVAEKVSPRKKAVATKPVTDGFSSARRVWPD